MSEEIETISKPPRGKSPSSLANLRRGGPGRGHFSSPEKAAKAKAEYQEVKDLGILARQHTMEAVRTILGIMQDGSSDTVKLQAAELVIDRGWSKAVQPILELPQSIEVRSPLTSNRMSEN